MIFTSPPISRSAIFQKTLLAACLSVVYTSCVLAQTHTDLKQTDLNATGFKPDVNDVKSIGPKAIYGDVFTTNRADSRKSKALTANAPYNPITNNDDQSQIPEIEMFVGESRVFPAPGVARIAVGNGALLTAAALESKEVLVFANAPGTSSLFVWNESGNYQRVKINIVAGETNRVSREIAVFLNTIPNTKSSIVGDKVVVEGDNLSDVYTSNLKKLPSIPLRRNDGLGFRK
jgi:Flp pilus assembly secretin CpaC